MHLWSSMRPSRPVDRLLVEPRASKRMECLVEPVRSARTFSLTSPAKALNTADQTAAGYLPKAPLNFDASLMMALR